MHHLKNYLRIEMEINSTTRKLWFIFDKDRLLMQKKGDGYRLPDGNLPPDFVTGERAAQVVASANGTEYMGMSGDLTGDMPEKFEMINLRASYDYLDEESYNMAGKAFEIIHWDRNSRYCPACGVPMVRNTPISKLCPSCGQEFYPAISTAIIVLIRREDAVLLVRAKNFKGNFHGLVAGFLETGETLEECVRREVMEETGLEIGNITYFGNQPWPYPSGLMVGFIADYAGGEIKLQQEELQSGAFFTKDRLPELPRKLSIARKMIDWWLEQS